MQNCPLSSFIRSAMVFVGVLLAFGAMTAAAHARYDIGGETSSYVDGYERDAMPGYRCHRWNRYGECTDESMYDLGRALPGSLFIGTTPSLLRCQSPTLDCTGRVSVRTRSVPTIVRRGGIITYTIYLRNDDSQTRTVHVRAFLDQNSELQSASAGYVADGRLVRWNALRMEPWASKMLVLRARVAVSAPYESELRMIVQAGNSADSTVTAVENTRDEDRVIGYPTAQYYPLGAVAIPSYRKPQHDPRNYYYDGDGVMQYRYYGRIETNFPYSRTYGSGCDRRYFSCEKRP